MQVVTDSTHEIKLWNIKLINFFCYVTDEILGGLTSSFFVMHAMQLYDVFYVTIFWMPILFKLNNLSMKIG